MEARGGFCGPPKARSRCQRSFLSRCCPERKPGDVSVGLWRPDPGVRGIFRATETQKGGWGCFHGFSRGPIQASDAFSGLLALERRLGMLPWATGDPIQVSEPFSGLLPPRKEAGGHFCGPPEACSALGGLFLYSECNTNCNKVILIWQ